jgi:hypothetical protein
MKNELKNMFTEHWKYLAVNAACKLNLFDALTIPKKQAKARLKTCINTISLITSEKYPGKLNAYHKAMFEYARDDYKTLPDKINFGIHKSVIDCGGGYGAAINAVKLKFLQITKKATTELLDFTAIV